MRRNEGRVVNTPLVFKRVLFQEKRKKRSGGRSGEEDEETGNGEETREDRRDGERKGLSLEIGEKKTMNAGGVANGI
ncbi:hypothetical protein TNCV_1877911 [Trichonephila clavipes]|nr:hypothetical protein TNCV_1877911 [Trichonephila clavipes]